MRRVWTSLGVGLGLLVLGVPGWIAYHSRDLASVDESGLLVEDRPRLLPAENAAVPLAHAARLLDWPSGEGAMERVRDIRNKAGSDSESARALVRRNEGALESLRQAMLIREIEISAEELLPTGNSPGASPFVLWLRLLEIHHVQGALRMADGDGEGAYQDALLGLRLADRMHSSRGAALPHALLAISLGDSALLQLRVLLLRGTVDRVNARRLIGAIEDSRLDPDSWARIWAGEYRQLRAVYTEEIQSQASPAFVPTSYVFHPNRTLQRLAGVYRELQRNSRVVCSQQQALQGLQPSSRLELFGLILEPNSIGNILHETMVPPFGDQRFRCDLASTASAVQVAIALKAHHDAEGELPVSLSELVPELLDEVPRDGFRGEPLRYARAERALYLTDGGEAWPLGF